MRNKGMRIRALLLCLLVFSAISHASAQGFRDLGADEVKKLIEGKKKVVLVDARTAQEYREGHVPSAINIPPDRVTAIGKYLPKDKKTPLVFYCRGIG